MIGIETRSSTASVVWQLASRASAPAPEATARPTPAPTAALGPGPTADPTQDQAAEPTPGPTQTPLAAHSGPLRVDGLAEVLATDLVMRAKPFVGAASEILPTRLQPGDGVFVVAGPVEGSGYAWYRVATSGGEIGWVAAGSADGEAWLEGRVLDRSLLALPRCPTTMPYSARKLPQEASRA